jgi:DNA-binding SARP family transcriptional activator
MTVSRKPTFRVLGHLEVGNGAAPALGGRKQRALLAYLLLHAGEPVTTGALVDAVWGDEAPATASAVVYAYVRKLRAVLEDSPGALVKDAAGYRLLVPAEEVDLQRFESLARRGKESLRDGRPGEAALLLGDALALWRGPPLIELECDASVDAARRRLEQERLDAAIDRNEAELALGRHEQLVPELTQLVSENPYAERLRAQLMLALYRSRRQADALDAYRDARSTLRDDLGLEPSPELRVLEQAILRQDEALAPAPIRDEHDRNRPRGRSRKLLLAGAVAFVLVAAVAAGLLLSRSSRTQTAVAPNSVAVVNPNSGTIVADVQVGADPLRVVAGDGAAWTINGGDQTLSRIDVPTLRTRTIGLAGTPAGLAVAHGAIWVGNGAAGSISRIGPRAGTEQLIPLGSESDADRTVARFASAVVPDGSAAWAVIGVNPPRLVQIDASGVGARRRADAARRPNGPNALAVAHGIAWSLGPAMLVRADLRRHATTTIPIGTALSDSMGGNRLPTGLAAGAGGVWATNPYENLVEEVSPQTGAQLATVDVPGRPTVVAVAGDTVWAGGLDGELSSVDASTGTVERTIPLGHPVTGLAFGYGRLWVAVAS